MEVLDLVPLDNVVLLQANAELALITALDPSARLLIAAAAVMLGEFIDERLFRMVLTM